MKSTHLIKCVGMLVTLTSGSIAWAQVAVTGISYGPQQNGANSYQGGVSFHNDYYEVESISTADDDYVFDGAFASDVYVRRNTSRGNPNNTTLIYQVDRRDRAYGSAPTTVEDIFLEGNLFSGVRDPFANTGSANSAQNSNIERFDFYLGNYAVEEGAGFVLMEFENSGNNGDPFRVAAFDGWDSSNLNPDSYTSTGLLIGADSFGDQLLSPTDNSSLEFNRATYTNGDDVSGTASNFTGMGGDLGLVGIFIRFTDLGLSVGDIIQGFSVMAADVAPTTSADLVDWTDSSVYRTDTDRNTYGNFDMMGFGAKLASPVPEPSSYGAIFMGLLGSFYAARRRRHARTTVVA